MPSIKTLLASSALVASVLAHPHAQDKRSEPVGQVITSCTTPGVVALTFDDGPYIYTNTLLDRLASHGFRATFFQNGNNWGSIYDYSAVLKRMITDKHQIASHTWDHKDLATLSDADVQSEMTQLETAYTSILGFYPYYMRPPFLSTSKSALAVLATLGYTVIEVDIDTQDWQNTKVSQEPLSFNNYTAGYAAGGRLSLSHDPYNTTVNGYIPELLDWLVGKGLQSVTVGECLGDAPENWYRTTRTNHFNPYVAVSSSASASASKAASASVAASSKPASASAAASSKAASASVVGSASVAGSASASGSAAVVSSAAAVVSKASSAAAGSASVGAASSAAASVAGSASAPAGSASASAPASIIKPSSVVAAASSPAAVKASSAAAAASAKPSGKVSKDGSCGGSKGYVCGAGECCSEYGWCGAAADYCGAGCQANFGSCSSSGSGSGSSGTPTESPDWTCGGTSNYKCPGSNCCSQYGWCGTSNAYCGAGCQSGFGTCQ